jgi:hypothetical protein
MRMDNKIAKYLYYRGIRFTKNLISKNVDAAKQLTYRGINFIKNQTQNKISNSKRMYRGLAM